MQPDRAWLAVLAIALLAGGATAIPAAADTTAARGGVPALDDAAPADTSASLAAQVNNSTVRHRNPDEAGEDGDVDAVRSWLAGRLGERLNESSVQLSQGEYEQAKSALGDEYRRELSKYVEVAGDTQDESDDEVVQELETARDRQEEYATLVEEYQETREEYEEAKAAGNNTRARELARELDRIAAEVDESGGNLSRNLESVSNGTGVDLGSVERTVDNTTRNVTEQQETIRAAEFVATELTATADADRTSFTAPLTVTGRLTAENGTPLADQTIVLEPGERTVRGTTDADGEFEIVYRPTAVSAGNVSLPVRFVPENASVYLGATANVTTVVERVEPSIRLSNHTERAGFGDRIGASGTVGVDGIGAAGVPLRVDVGGIQVGNMTTDADGEFAFEGPLPAGIESGERRLRVRVAGEDRALSGGNASAPLTVATTETAMALNATSVEGRSIDVEGRLETVDGRALENRTVVIAVNETGVTTVTTGSNGTVAANVTVPAAIETTGGAATAIVTGRFDGAGTNLGPTAAESRVTLSTGDARGGLFGLGLPWWGWLGAAVVVVAIPLVALYRLRDRGVEPGEAPQPTRGGEPAGAVDAESAPDTASLLEVARNRLRSGSADEAVEAGYGAVRRGLEGALDVASPRTHWEFYRACRAANLDPDRTETLRRLTELYERAAFTPDPVSTDTAEDAVAAASDFTVRPDAAEPSDD